MNRLSSLVALVGASWVLAYIFFAGDDPGKSLYADMAGAVFPKDPKGGVPMLHLAFPVLISGSVASLCWTLPPLSLHRITPIHQRCYSTLPYWIQRRQYRVLIAAGDWNFDLWAILLILLPSSVFLFMTIYRHMKDGEGSLDEQIMDVSNAFGMMAEVVGSFLLIPVARHSSLLKVMSWSPARAVRLHVWTGRIFILAVIVHGGMHIYRWLGLSSESLTGMLLPPSLCWTFDSQQYEDATPTCVDQDTDCSCYDLFRNLTGFLSGVALLVLLVTSLHQIRRQFYRLFYMSHIIAAPVALIMVILHWNRSILFMAPSLIYYIASSFPSFVERWVKQLTKGIEVVAFERIPPLSDLKQKHHSDNADDGNFMLEATQYTRSETSHYISLTVRAREEAVRQFRPGYYVQLLAPDVSNISHPFTINLVPGKQGQMRIIFKAQGNFTAQLSQLLQESMRDDPRHLSSTPKNTIAIRGTMPQIHMDGYFGTPNRVREVLRHDVATIIAGGIGITPYLTLLHHVHDLLAQAPPSTFATKRIVLVWICRDAALVDYVKREYMQPLLKSQHKRQFDFKIKFIIYHTGEPSAALPIDDEEIPACRDCLAVARNEGESWSMGLQFAPSRFAAGSSSSFKPNILGFMAFTCTAWLGLVGVWLCYRYKQQNDEVATRLWGIVSINATGMLVAVIANLLAILPLFQVDNAGDLTRKASWSPLPSSEPENSTSDVLARTSSTGIEMDTVRPASLFIDEAGAVYDDEAGKEDPVSGSTADVVTIDEKRGRPTVHQMMKYVDNARHPGLFTCGPLGMMKDIRDHTDERCLLRLKQCMPGAARHIAIYEEAFTP
jgi:NAD(P)H-flavin reductase